MKVKLPPPPPNLIARGGKQFPKPPPPMTDPRRTATPLWTVGGRPKMKTLDEHNQEIIVKEKDAWLRNAEKLGVLCDHCDGVELVRRDDYVFPSGNIPTYCPECKTTNFMKLEPVNDTWWVIFCDGISKEWYFWLNKS